MLTSAIVAVATLMSADDAGAQPVAQFVQITSPSRNVAHEVSVLQEYKKPRVALFRSNQTSRYVPNGESTVREAVYFWELLLLGLRVPYKVLDDQDLSRRISDNYRVIILPAVESMSKRQRRRVIDYLKDGGGVIASGRTGVFDEEGSRVGGLFFEEAFGAEYVDDLPAQSFGILQSIDGNTPLGDGIPMGYLLNVAPQLPMTALRPVSSVAMGRPMTYTGADMDAFRDLTLLLYGTLEEGRFFWSRFHPHDISRDPVQQENYQRMIVNALVDLAGGTTVSVSPWPNGNPMALSVVTLSTVGFDAISFMDGTRHLLDILKSHNIPATFFLTSGDISTFPDLYFEAVEIGEIGIAADTDHVLKGQPWEVQKQRFLRSLNEMGLEDPHGLYPPGGFFDGNTVRAMDDMGLDYIVLPGPHSLAPGNIDWWSHVDYREGLLLSDIEVDTAPLFVPGRQPASQAAPRGPEVPSPIASMPIVEGLSSTFESTYEIVRRARGLYSIPYYPELYSSRSVESQDFEATLTRAQREGAWITTMSEILRWWRVRTNIRPIISSLGRNEMYIDIENSHTAAVQGVTLEVRLGRPKAKNLRLSGEEGDVLRLPDGRTSLVVLPELRPGMNRFVLIWDD